MDQRNIGAIFVETCGDIFVETNGMLAKYFL